MILMECRLVLRFAGRETVARAFVAGAVLIQLDDEARSNDTGRYRLSQW